jgi:uncharacterized protein YbjT (DUF2867 family)
VAAALQGADAAINLVGVLHESGRRTFQALHVDGARNVAEACAAANIDRLVQVSAIGANPESESATTPAPRPPAEMAVRAVKPDAVMIRPSIVFGAGDGFLNRFASMAQLAPALPLIGGGETKFQPVYVGDVAEAIARATVLRRRRRPHLRTGRPGRLDLRRHAQMILRETYRATGP